MIQDIAKMIWKYSMYNDENYDVKGIQEFIVTDIYGMVTDGEVVAGKPLEEWIVEIHESFDDEFDPIQQSKKERLVMSLCHKIGIIPTNVYNDYLSYFQDEVKMMY
jgi:hypothetical protein